MNNYILSFSKKIDRLFWNKEVSAIVFIYDDENDNTLNQVLFFEMGDSKSLLLLFMQDEIFVELDSSMSSYYTTLERHFQHLSNENVQILEKSKLDEKWIAIK